MFIFLSTSDLHWTIQEWHLIKEIQAIRCYAWMAGHNTIFVAIIRNNYVLTISFKAKQINADIQTTLEVLAVITDPRASTRYTLSAVLVPHASIAS